MKGRNEYGDTMIRDAEGNALWQGNPSSIKALMKDIRKKFPKEWWEKYFRKRYAVPSTHHDPAIYNFCELGSLMEKDKNATPYGADTDFNTNTIKKAHEELSRCNYPTYFLHEHTLAMLNNTGMGDSVPLDKIRFPFPAFLIAMPKGGYVQEMPEGLEDEEVVAMSVTQTYDVQSPSSVSQAISLKLPETHGRYYNPQISALVQDCLRQPAVVQGDLSHDEAVGMVEEKLSKQTGEPVKVVPAVTFIIAMSNGEVCTGSYPITSDGILPILEKYQDIYSVDQPCEQVYGAKAHQSGRGEKDLMRDDVGMMHDVIALAMKVVLYMTARKDAWTGEDKIQRPAKTRGDKILKDALWSPNWIGGAPQSAPSGERGEPTGKKIRYHWRSGHFKGQRYGAGRKLVKVIWVEPYPVNADEK